ncbi:unnamed protein product [Timema podura]|uniref:Uncharacterized protein n=1 Tax=Timema podura TaxID=61482 RepID=A0ABN7NP97_TIMPD|nr:unnamed protein product [Timema podura]
MLKLLQMTYHRLEWMKQKVLTLMDEEDEQLFLDMLQHSEGELEYRMLAFLDDDIVLDKDLQKKIFYVYKTYYDKIVQEEKLIPEEVLVFGYRRVGYRKFCPGSLPSFLRGLSRVLFQLSRKHFLLKINGFNRVVAAQYHRWRILVKEVGVSLSMVEVAQGDRVISLAFLWGCEQF